MSSSKFDPYSDSTLSNPFPAYGGLLSGTPVATYQREDKTYYVISHQSDIKELLRNVDVWSSRFGPCPKDLPTENAGLNSDAPIHTEWRRIFAARFTPQAMAKHENTVRRIANELIDEMLTKNSGDLHDDFSTPLVVQVMAHIVGLPPEQYRLYKECADKSLVASFNSMNINDAIEATQKNIVPILMKAINERRQKLVDAGITDPKPEHVDTVLSDDLISTLVCGSWQGRRLTDEELIGAAQAFFVGGAETTSSWILCCMRRLLEVPERWERLKREPNLLPQVLEETLRHDPPVLGLFRKNVVPTSLHGVEIPQGSRLMYAIAAANREPEIFSQPDEFVMDRPLPVARKHISFGYGTHTCPGAALARLEAPIALSLLIERLPNIQIAGRIERIPVFNYWGYSSFPATW